MKLEQIYLILVSLASSVKPAIFVDIPRAVSMGCVCVGGNLLPP